MARCVCTRARECAHARVCFAGRVGDCSWQRCLLPQCSMRMDARCGVLLDVDKRERQEASHETCDHVAWQLRPERGRALARRWVT